MTSHPDFPFIQVFAGGNVYNWETKRWSRLPEKQRYARMRVRGKRILVHRLVAETLVPNPLSLKVVNHKDTNTRNNDPSNLEWCSQRYNTQPVNMMRAFGGIQESKCGTWRLRVKMHGGKRKSYTLQSYDDAITMLEILREEAVRGNHINM
jgi:hypothetical protein